VGLSAHDYTQSHLDNHLELPGFILGQDDALTFADFAFGLLLAS
jgi:hypothetical protein